MALAERRNCKDCISIFACSSWELVKVDRLQAVIVYGVTVMIVL